MRFALYIILFAAVLVGMSATPRFLAPPPLDEHDQVSGHGQCALCKATVSKVPSSIPNGFVKIDSRIRYFPGKCERRLAHSGDHVGDECRHDDQGRGEQGRGEEEEEEEEDDDEEGLEEELGEG